MFSFIKGKKPESQEKTESWGAKLKSGLLKSSDRLNDGIKEIFVRKKLDDETLEKLEELLITSDIGAETSAYIVSELAKNKFDKEITPEEVKTELAAIIGKILEPYAKPINISKKPHIILFCGVNGTGKTTTIGKLARQYSEEGKKVMVAACDTFRAAAIEQLDVWAGRAGCPIIRGAENADPASVAYEAMERAKAENIDILLIDTAGRLQNKTNLMDQLSKIIRVIQKADSTVPHDTIIVLDATTGQNAASQVKIFSEMVNISGIIITKLDGTAKGGVVVSLARQFGLPVHAIGVGEKVEDLRSFSAKDFATNLVGR